MENSLNKNDSEHISNPESWVDKYGNYLYRIAIQRTKDKNLAEDLVQETFMSALKGRHSFQGKSSEKTWMVSILKNKIIDNFRINSKYVGLDNEMFEETFGFFQKEGAMKGNWNTELAPQKWSDSPDDVLESNELLKTLHMCIEKMPKQLSIIFTIKEIDGLNTKEICKEFDISMSNLWVILHRARLLMRSCMEKNWFTSTIKGQLNE